MQACFMSSILKSAGKLIQFQNDFQAKTLICQLV